MLLILEAELEAGPTCVARSKYRCSTQLVSPSLSIHRFGFGVCRTDAIPQTSSSASKGYNKNHLRYLAGDGSLLREALPCRAFAPVKTFNRGPPTTPPWPCDFTGQVDIPASPLSRESLLSDQVPVLSNTIVSRESHTCHSDPLEHKVRAYREHENTGNSRNRYLFAIVVSRYDNDILYLEVLSPMSFM